MKVDVILFNCTKTSACMHWLRIYNIIIYDTEVIILVLHVYLNLTELTHRVTTDAFYNGELESEVRTLSEEGKLTLKRIPTGKA